MTAQSETSSPPVEAFEVLRQAAALMREKASKATPPADPHPGGWLGYSNADDNEDGRAELFAGPGEVGYRSGSVFRFASYTDCEECARPTHADVDYMGSWDPTVALAVADWLDMEANNCESSTAIWERSSLDPENTWAERGLTVEANVEHHWRNALRVARAYIGGPRTSEDPSL